MVLVTQKKRTAPTHQKRRQGKHHKHSPDYHKAYWPYLPMGLIVGLGVLVNTFWGTVQQNVLSYATNMSTSGLLQETNQERVAGGLESLTLNAELNQAAQAKANDMVARNYWSHNTPEGNPPWVFISDAGYEYKSAGENLAYGFENSTEAVAGWMASPGHKANIMNTGYNDVGFGIANSPSYQGTGQQTIVVAMYGSPQVLAAAPSTPKATTQPKEAPEAALAPVAPEEIAVEPAPAPKEEVNVTPVAAEEQTEEKTEAAAPQAVAASKVARIQLLSSATPSWSAFFASAIATVAIAIFFLRHGLFLRRVLIRSEAFIHKHPFLDIALVAVATIGFVLTRTDGIIR
jgi:hypothetical protein